ARIGLVTSVGRRPSDGLRLRRYWQRPGACEKHGRGCALEGAPMAPAIDWVAVRWEAHAVPVDYLRIDTWNPPGNEAAGARFLGALLEAEGVETRYFETAPGREILYARIPGDGSRGSFMLSNHIDTVPVEPAYWTKPAFEGVEEGNRIYGRGAVD